MEFTVEHALDFSLGFLLSLIVVFPAAKRGSLTGSGAAAALGIGMFLYGFGGLPVFSVLIGFFLSATLLSRWSNRQKDAGAVGAVVEKGSKRDHIQVLANGGPAVVMLLLYGAFGHEGFRIGAVMTLAAANADTWASELGVMSQSVPVFIIKKTPVPKGISGGVTGLGFLASLLGAFFIAVLYVGTALTVESTSLIDGALLMLVITAIGFSGSVIDSVIGELWQAQYRGSASGKTYLTEKRREQGKQNSLVKGYSIIDNNMVNFLSTFSTALIGIVILSFI